MDKKKIVVLRGGPSSEYDISILTGKTVINILRDKYHVTDCVIDKNGKWFVNGIENSPHLILRNHDHVFNAMHGEFGEDGTIQQILEKFGARFTGPTSLGARLSMNKPSAKKIFEKFGIKTPLWRIVNKEDDINQTAIDVFRSMTMPVIIKPIDRGSSVGVSIARDYKTLIETLISLFVRYDRLLVEEYIKGREATVGVVDNFRGSKHYALLPVEIRLPKEKDFFDYDAKYSKMSAKLCPGNFSKEEKDVLQKMAVLAHDALGLRHYSRSDFIVHPQRGIYLLEVNALPGLTEESLLPISLKSVGIDLGDFLDHVIDLSAKIG